MVKNCLIAFIFVLFFEFRFENFERNNRLHAVDDRYIYVARPFVRLYITLSLVYVYIDIYSRPLASAVKGPRATEFKKVHYCHRQSIRCQILRRFLAFIRLYCMPPSSPSAIRFKSANLMDRRTYEDVGRST